MQSMASLKRILLRVGIILALAFVVYIATAILALYWPVYCKRCGRGQIGVFVSGRLGDPAGDRVLYCQNFGHAWTVGINRKRTLRDWRYQRESYPTEAKYLEALKYKDQDEAFRRDSGKSGD